LFKFLIPIRLTKTAIAKNAHPTVIPTITPVAKDEAVLLSVVVVVTLVELIADFRANNIKLKYFKLILLICLNYFDTSKKTQISMPSKFFIVLIRVLNVSLFYPKLS